MSKGCNNSGLSTWMAEQLRYMAVFEAWQINLMISIVAAIVTEFVSNTATANILVPILRELSISLCRNPIHLGKQAPFLFFTFTLNILESNELFMNSKKILLILLTKIRLSITNVWFMSFSTC